MPLNRKIEFIEIVLQKETLADEQTPEADNPENVVLRALKKIEVEDDVRGQKTEGSDWVKTNNPTRMRRILRDFLGQKPGDPDGKIGFGKLDPDKEN